MFQFVTHFKGYRTNTSVMTNIQRCACNHRMIFCAGADHQPFTLAVSGTSVVWTDHIKRSVWSLELEPATLESPVPRRLGVYISSPRALAPAHTARWQKDRCNKVVIPQVEVTRQLSVLLIFLSYIFLYNAFFDVKMLKYYIIMNQMLKYRISPFYGFTGTESNQGD